MEHIELIRNMLTESADVVEVNRKLIQCSSLDEVHTGAIQSIQHAFSDKLKDAKQCIREANQLASDGKNADAKKKLDEAIKLLKDGRKDAEKIDDDGILEHLIISGVMSIVGPIGTLAVNVGYYVSWYNLHTGAKEGKVEYSKTHPTMKPNLVMEWLFGKLIAKGYSRATVLAGYDKLIKECETLKSQMK